MPYSASPLPSGVSVPKELPEATEGFADSSFTGRLIRPKSARTGMTAQVFGENGSEADLISALNLEQFRNATVKIMMVFLKNADGRLLKDKGEYPRAVFEAIIKRPLPHANGMIAQFFAENGVNADEVTKLALTQYLDAQVFVNISRQEDASVATIPEEALNEAAQRLTPAEAKRLTQEQKKAGMAWNQLNMGGFFRKAQVLRALGDTASFESWVITQPCCHPGGAPCPNRDVRAVLVPDPSQRYRHIPLCNEHAALWEQGQVTLPHNTVPLTFMIGELGRLVPQWGQVRLREALNTPVGHQPTPSAIYRFAIERRLTHELPPGFTAFFQA